MPRGSGQPSRLGALSLFGASIALFILTFGAAALLSSWRSSPPSSPSLSVDASAIDDAAVSPPTVANANPAGGGDHDSGSIADAAESGDASSPLVSLRGRKLNVILITIDTLRADLGYAGYPRPVTPNLDALAARSGSIVFERAYATAPYTMKSLAALMLGRYTSEASRDWAHYTKYFASNVFLAERVQAAGARTVAVMSHRYFSMKPGFEQGFDVFDISAMPPNMTDTDLRPTSQELTDVTLRLLAKPENTPSADRKLFAWIHYFDPHAPYVGHPGAPAFGSMEATSPNRSRDLYDDEVWFTDKHVGRVLDFVAKSPWADDTAIIITADHGEAFGEKGHYRHGKELWESLVRVPLIVSLPPSLASLGVATTTPRRIPIKRSHIDVVPTILELMGVSTEEPPALRGKSLLADVFAPPGAALEERDVFMDVPEGQMNEPRRAILIGKTPGLKLIKRKQLTELYDLTTDPNEANDLSSSDAARLAEARARYDAFTSLLEEQKVGSGH